MKQTSVIKEYARKLKQADDNIKDRKSQIDKLEADLKAKKQIHKDELHNLKLESQSLGNSLRDQHVQKLESELADKQTELVRIEHAQTAQSAKYEAQITNLNSIALQSVETIESSNRKIRGLEQSLQDVESSADQRMRKMSDNIHVLEAHANSPKRNKEDKPDAKDKQTKGIYVEVKFDGTHCQIHKQGDKVAIYSEDGQDYTKNCPTLISELKKHRDDFVVCAELESWKDKVHQPRATTAGILNSKEVHADESTLRANVFDCLYKGEDIHNMPYCERLEALAGTKDTAHFVKNDRKVCRTEDQLRKAINEAADEPGSEGAMCLPAQQTIMSNPGLIPIGDVQIGTKVWTSKGLKKVTKTYTRNYTGDLIHVSPKYMKDFEVTSEHPIMTSKGWIRASDLTTRDLLTVPRFSNKHCWQQDNQPFYIEVPHKGKCFIDLNGEKKLLTERIKINKTQEFFKVIGLWLSEGSASKLSSCYAFGLHEKSYANLVRNYWQKIFPNNKVSIYEKHNAYIVSIPRNLTEFFTKNFGLKSGERHLPNSFFKLSKTSIKNLIKFYWLGDGSCDKKSISFHSVSLTLLSQIQLLLFGLGIASYFDKAQSLKTPRLRISGQDKRKFKKIFTNGSYCQYSKWRRMIQATEPERHLKAPATFSNKCVTIPISKIESKKVRDISVYNIETETGDFLIPPLVHNCKTTDFKYELDRQTAKNVKFKVELSCDCQVIRVNKAGTVWNYDCALKGKDGLAYVGITYNTSVKASVGEILKVAFVDISAYTTKAGKKWARWYSPHVIQKRTDKKTPDTVDTAWRMAKETTGRFDEKEEPEIMKDFGLWPLPEEHQDIIIDPDKYYDSACAYLIENPDRCQWLKKGTSLPTFIPENKADEIKDWLLEDVRILEKDKPHIFRDVCILWDGVEVKLSGAMRDSKIVPNSFSSKKRFVIQNHFRGASSHLDARFEMDKFLEGFTIACANESKIIEPVLTMADGKKLMDDSSVWKLDLKTGEEKVRKGTGGRETAEKLWASFKSRQPISWIDVSGTTPKRDDDPGTAGGTKQYPGVFVVVDKGTFDRGASKSYYKEYFLNGPKWKGRYIFRQVAGLQGSKKPLTWLYWKADDITPYALSSRAVRENWMPKGYSALPSAIEQKVPGDLNYWKPGLTSQQRLDRRKALRKHFLKQKEFSIIEQDFIKPTKPYLDMDAHQSNEFFMLKDMNDFDYTNKILERKFDGLRMQIHKKGNSVKAYSAYGNQFQLNRLGHIPEEIKKLDSYSFILDGELVLPGKDRDVVHDAITTEGSDELEYMVFDILQVNDNRMIKSVLSDRKRVLHRMSDQLHVKLTRPVIVTKDNIKPLLEGLQKRGYEGAVIKDLNSEYQDRKSWHKFVFISNYLKPIEELDEFDNEHLNNYRIALRRLERKLKENKTIPISTDELYKQKDKVAELLTRDHATPKFTLTRRYWRGADVVRKMDVEDFHLKLECPAAYKFHLDKNPINTDSVTAVHFTEGGKYFKPGEYAPNSDINPNKKIPAFIESICSGAFEVMVEQDKLMQVHFKGKNLNGMYVFRRTSPKDTMWSMEKQASPKLHRRSITFSIKDFSAGDPKLSEDITFPYKRRTIAFAPGIWHDTVYSWDVVKRSADKFLGVPIVIEHSEDIMDDIGTVTEVFVNEDKQRIEVEFELIDTENGKDTAILLENNKIKAVSTGLDEWSQTMNGMETCNEIVNIRHVAVVGSPEVRTALVCDKDGDCH